MPRPRNLGSIDDATARRLLTDYLPLVLSFGRVFYSLDKATLRSVGEDALLEAYLTFDASRGCSEAVWMRRNVYWRLAAAVERRGLRPAGDESLGPDPQVVNGVNPEVAFLQATAVQALERLSIRQQMVVDGRMRGETFAEIGPQLGISDTMAHREWTTAIAILRDVLGYSALD